VRLDERMLQQRRVALSGTLDREASSQAHAYGLIDATVRSPRPS
jgi:hypothetical protein